MSVEIRVALLIGLFALGLVCRRAGWLKPAHAGFMLRLVINLGLPALFLADVSRIRLQPELLALPASSLCIMVAIWGLALLLARALRLDRTDRGTAIISGMSINNGFLFPFVIAVWGVPGFGQMALFDLGHVLGQSFLVYAIATAYGGHVSGFGPILRRVLRFPPLWALLVALLINGSGAALPEWLVTVLHTVGQWILLLVIVALGVLFDARLLRDRRVPAIVLLRMLAGELLGLICVRVFGLTGLTRAVVLLGAAAPIGFNAVVLSDMEKLNRELAASAASISVVIGLVYAPLALWLLPR
ncbi:MAG TPA: AEC family transporter [Steroidobacteraceae bacterium]|nr:AEC family transporter [Steroidobacteraceae bacterium]